MKTSAARQRPGLAVILGSETRDDEGYEHFHVFDPLARGRHVELQPDEPPGDVEHELALRDRLMKVPFRRRHEVNVHSLLAKPADNAARLLLERVCLLGERSCEGAFLVTEALGLDELGSK